MKTETIKTIKKLLRKEFGMRPTKVKQSKKIYKRKKKVVADEN